MDDAWQKEAAHSYLANYTPKDSVMFRRLPLSEFSREELEKLVNLGYEKLLREQKRADRSADLLSRAMSR